MNWLRHPRVNQCARILVSGGVIAYPTEAVWGLGCDPFNSDAVSQVLGLKNRAENKGLILVAADIHQFDFLLSSLSPAQKKVLQSTWPGHVSWLVPHHNRVPHYLSGEHSSIALRVSAHPLVQALCLLSGGPIVSTSANPQARMPARNALKVRCYFPKAKITYAPQVRAKAQAPSEIRDLVSGKVIRKG